MDFKIAEFKEQLEVLNVEQARLESHLAALKEATKGDALAFEEKLKEVIMQSEKNKQEMEQKPRPQLTQNPKLNRSFMSNASDHRPEAPIPYRYMGKGNEPMTEQKALEYRIKLGQELEKIQAATGIEDTEVLFETLGSIEQENFKQLCNINELNNQIEDLEEQLATMRKERDELRSMEQKTEESSRFQFFKQNLEEKAALIDEISEIKLQNEGSESRLVAQLKELSNLFYIIGCDKAVDRSELKSDFLGKENLAEILRIIENRMQESLFVYHLVVYKVNSKEQNDGTGQRKCQGAFAREPHQANK